MRAWIKAFRANIPKLSLKEQAAKNAKGEEQTKPNMSLGSSEAPEEKIMESPLAGLLDEAREMVDAVQAATQAMSQLLGEEIETMLALPVDAPAPAVSAENLGLIREMLETCEDQAPQLTALLGDLRVSQPAAMPFLHSVQEKLQCATDRARAVVGEDIGESAKLKSRTSHESRERKQSLGRRKSQGVGDRSDVARKRQSRLNSMGATGIKKQDSRNHDKIKETGETTANRSEDEEEISDEEDEEGSDFGEETDDDDGEDEFDDDEEFETDSEDESQYDGKFSDVGTEEDKEDRTKKYRRSSNRERPRRGLK